MKLTPAALLALSLVACKSSDSDAPRPTPPPKSAPAPAAPKPAPAPDAQPELKFEGSPFAQDPDFPKDRWVHTVLFDGKTPFIGFTYVDAEKGNCIKGEEVTGLSDADIKKKLHSDFPSESMEPIPDGHPITVLTPDEIKKYDLPAKPDWVSSFEH